MKGHNRRNPSSHWSKHSLETGHEHATSSDFSIISKKFNGNKHKQKRNITEPLLVKQLYPTLNVHDKSVPLELFN